MPASRAWPVKPIHLAYQRAFHSTSNPRPSAHWLASFSIRTLVLNFPTINCLQSGLSRLEAVNSCIAPFCCLELIDCPGNLRCDSWSQASAHFKLSVWRPRRSVFECSRSDCAIHSSTLLAAWLRGSARRFQPRLIVSGASRRSRGDRVLWSISRETSADF